MRSVLEKKAQHHTTELFASLFDPTPSTKNQKAKVPAGPNIFIYKAGRGKSNLIRFPLI